jgi:hypothetical protein
MASYAGGRSSPGGEPPLMGPVPRRNGPHAPLGRIPRSPPFPGICHPHEGGVVGFSSPPVPAGPACASGDQFRVIVDVRLGIGGGRGGLVTLGARRGYAPPFRQVDFGPESVNVSPGFGQSVGSARGLVLPLSREVPPTISALHHPTSDDLAFRQPVSYYRFGVAPRRISAVGNGIPRSGLCFTSN